MQALVKMITGHVPLGTRRRPMASTTPIRSCRYHFEYPPQHLFRRHRRGPPVATPAPLNSPLNFCLATRVRDPVCRLGRLCRLRSAPPCSRFAKLPVAMFRCACGDRCAGRMA